MEVLFIARPNLFTEPGGDTTQLLSTAKYLEKLGVHVDFGITASGIDYNRYDLIHFFNIIDPEDILGHLLKTGKPSVLSSIYVNYREFDKLYRTGLVGCLSRFLPYHTIEYLKTLLKFLLKGEKVSSYRYFLWGNKKSIRYILKRVGHILPNSESELGRLKKSFGKLPPATVVVNAIDRDIFFDRDKQPHVKEGVLCVARIEGNKNQLNLIRAFRKLPYRLTIVGKASANQKKYYDQCRKEAGDNVLFIDQMSQNELVGYYRQAKVHVLPSWFETTGLSSLEAAAMGCNIVVTDKGDVKEYFGAFAFYCDPADSNSIADAVTKAMEQATNPLLSEYVLNNYIWEKTATQTLAAYKKV
ncbi:MAG: glycosyltransferase family 4 protein, partial [Bacteroidota bacterium]